MSLRPTKIGISCSAEFRPEIALRIPERQFCRKTGSDYRSRSLNTSNEDYFDPCAVTLYEFDGAVLHRQ